MNLKFLVFLSIKRNLEVPILIKWGIVPILTAGLLQYFSSIGTVQYLRGLAPRLSMKEGRHNLVSFSIDPYQQKYLNLVIFPVGHFCILQKITWDQSYIAGTLHQGDGSIESVKCAARLIWTFAFSDAPPPGNVHITSGLQCLSDRGLRLSKFNLSFIDFHHLHCLSLDNSNLRTEGSHLKSMIIFFCDTFTIVSLSHVLPHLKRLAKSKTSNECPVYCGHRMQNAKDIDQVQPDNWGCIVWKAYIKVNKN